MSGHYFMDTIEDMECASCGQMVEVIPAPTSSLDDPAWGNFTAHSRNPMRQICPGSNAPVQMEKPQKRLI